MIDSPGNQFEFTTWLIPRGIGPRLHQYAFILLADSPGNRPNELGDDSKLLLKSLTQKNYLVPH